MEKRSESTKKDGQDAPVDKRKDRYKDHRVQRRDALISQATALFASHGMRGLTIDEIAQKMSIAKPALYRYFESKDSLIHAVLAEASDSLLEADLTQDSSDWRRQLQGAVNYVAERPDVYIVLLRHAANDAEYSVYFERYYKSVVDMTCNRIKRFSDHPPRPPVTYEFCARAMVSFIFSSVLTWIDEGQWEPFEFHRWLVRSCVALTERWEDHSRPKPTLDQDCL